jgi:dipeptidyl aminopeptidase/acylaminoacyl peptidase
LLDWIAPVAKHGFTVFASQYRTNDEFGGADLNDILTLIGVAKNYPRVDSSKVGMIGWSRGGMMTYLALAVSGEIDCAVIGGAPTDMSALLVQRPEMEAFFARMIPDYSANRKNELEKRSAILFADKLKTTHLLIIHGALDERVHASHAVNMSEKLKSVGYLHTLRIIENDNHILNANRNYKDELIGGWLKEHLEAKWSYPGKASPGRAVASTHWIFLN